MGDIGFDSGFCNSGFSVQDDKTTQKLVVGNCGNTGAVSEQREHTACPGGSMRVEESSLEEGQPVPALGAVCTRGWRSDRMPPSLHHSKLQKPWSHSIYIQFCCFHAKVVSQRGNKNG